MAEDRLAREPDAVILPLLQARGEGEAQSHLARLIRERAEPVIRRVLKRRGELAGDGIDAGRPNSASQENEEILRDVVADLLARLQEYRADPGSRPIEDFTAYVAVTTAHACDRHVRRKYPQRWHLKHRLRYLLSHHPALAEWPGPGGDRQCGLAAWRGQRATTNSEWLARLQGDLPAFQRSALGGRDPETIPTAELLAGLLRWIGRPVTLDDVVCAVSTLQRVNERVDTGARGGGRVPDVPERNVGGPDDIAALAGEREYLRHLWREVRQLPPKQRAALLLNLRDAAGRGVIALFPVTGIATIAQLAEALSLPLARFAGLWNDLPLEDAEIARLLGSSRQQIINLRQAARKRLARRMREFD